MKTIKLILPFILLFAGICIQLNAATITVTSTANSGAGSLRDQIAAAAPGDSITFDSSINGIPIVLTTGHIVIDKDLTLSGNGISNTIIDGNNASRIFNITAGNVTIQGLTIQNTATSGFQNGGGIASSSTGIINIDHCAFLSCSTTGDGGGIATAAGTMNITACTFDGNHTNVRAGGIKINGGTVTIEASTFTNNTSTFSGAGIENAITGTVTVKNTTISANSAGSDGGGFRTKGNMTLINCTIVNNNATSGGGGEHVSGTLMLSNCIVYNNTTTEEGPDLHATIVSGGYNIIGNTSGISGLVVTDMVINPLLDTLADNGGPTKTIALLSGSPAIDAADSATTGTDQRGVAMSGCRRDIGAFEFEVVCPSLTASLTGPGSACAFSAEAYTYATQLGMTNYSWTVNGTAGVDYGIVTGGGAGDNFVELLWGTNGNHTVTVSYTNPAYPCCIVASGSITTSVSGAMIPIIADPPVVCVNEVSTFSINPEEGITYDWYIYESSSDYIIISGGGYNDTSMTVQWLTTGLKMIDLSYSDYLGCSGHSYSGVGVLSTTCDITGDGVICLGGSTILDAGSHSHYLWSTTDTTQTISVNALGVYTVTVSDEFGCTASASVTITQTQPLIATCVGSSNGNASVTVSGGMPVTAEYLWSNGATTSAINNLTPGIYTVTVTRGVGCNATCSSTITEPPPLVATCSGTNVTCAGGNGTAAVTVTGGPSTVIGLGPVAGALPFQGSPDGYFAGISDTCDCPTGYVAVGFEGRYGDLIDQFNLKCRQLLPDGTLGAALVNTCTNGISTGGVPAGPYLSPTNEALVKFTILESYFTLLGNNYVFLHPIGINADSKSIIQIYSYSDSGNETGLTNIDGFHVFGGLGYYHPVTAPNGNVITGMINYQPELQYGVVQAVQFRYAPVTDVPATVQYLWSNGATTSGINNLTAGTYTVTVTRGSCSTTCSYTVTEPSALNVDAGPNKYVFRGYPDSLCTTLQSTISGGTPPLTRLWSTAGNSNLGSGSSLNVCNLTTPKIYYLTVTDANGCSKTDSARVCVFDVRCGSGNKKVTICHGTGSASNPFQTLCILPVDAVFHFMNHPGEKLGTCGMSRTCPFPIMPNRLDEMTEEEYDMSLTAYPNPASETINISFYSEDSKIYSLRVINITGQIVLSETKQAEEGENNFTLNLQGFAAGMYMVLLQSGDNIMQTRIVKQ